MIDHEPPPDPHGFDGVEWDEIPPPPVPDAVDLVLETSTMMSVLTAQQLVRIDAMRREQLDVPSGRRLGMREVLDRSIRLELAAAMRITEYAAGRLIGHAEAMVRRYPEALASLFGGRMTDRHAEILVDLVDELPPGLRPGIVERAVALAESEPVGTFRRALRALIETVQAATLQERYAHAVTQRRVVFERGADGMGALTIFGPEVEAHAIFGRLTAMGKAILASEGETRTLDQVRADIAADLLIDGATDHVPAAASGIRAQVVVTVPVLSLLDEPAAPGAASGTRPAGVPGAVADFPVVEGIGPIPVSRARELCGGDSTWMRVLTHPETGMVLSVGRDRYPPPESLRRLVKWRADRCMGPGCGMPASRCEVDHQIRWVDGGETCLSNHAPFCKGHHIVKDNSEWVVRQLEGSGGAIEWISPMGRRYVVQPERRVPVFTVARDSTVPYADASDAPF